jgi:hypothetical protein
MLHLACAFLLKKISYPSKRNNTISTGHVAFGCARKESKLVSLPLLLPSRVLGTAYGSWHGPVPASWAALSRTERTGEVR